MKKVLCLVAVVALGAAAAPRIDAATGAQLTLGGPDAWRVDTQNSAAGFAVRHMLVSTVRGHLGPVSGTVWYDGKSVTSVRAEITIDVKSLQTGNDTRDNHLRTNDFFNAQKFPTITFKSKRAAAGADGHFILVGDLTIRDVTKPITIPIEFTGVETDAFGALRAGFEGTRRIDRREYGLEWNMPLDSGGWLVSEKITLEFEISAIKRESDAQQAA